jgi:hypothetical protein
MCGHAHHDDMLYFGKEPDQFLEFVPPEKIVNGYVDTEKYNYWYQKDPVKIYHRQLLEKGILDEAGWQKMIADTESEIETAAREIIAAPWPHPELAGHPVVTDGESQLHRELLERSSFHFSRRKNLAAGRTARRTIRRQRQNFLAGDCRSADGRNAARSKYFYVG